MSKLPATQLLDTVKATAYYTFRETDHPELPYSGFNLCHYTGDAPGHIADCRDLLSRHFNIPAEHIIVPRQTHSTNVAAITSLPVTPSAIEDVDALVTNRHDIIIGVNTADCVPVVLIDPVTGVNGIAHAGWRGAVNGVVEATLQAMITFGANPSDITAAMGPSICVDCFEVGPEVAAHFSKECISQHEGCRPHVSLHKHIHNILLNSGVTIDNIQPFNADMCTRCHPEMYWSARRMGINSGRIYTFIVPK